MFRTLIIAATLSFTLSACDAATKKAPPVIEQKTEKTLKDVDPVAYHENVQAAMTEVPPQLMPRFQKLFVCEMKRNNKLPEPKPVTADYIRSLTDHLKANPTAGDTCNA